MLALPLKIYAQPSIDKNKNPMILMDKQVIEADRRILESAQKSKAPRAIKSARQKLQFDMRRMKANKIALENAR